MNEKKKVSYLILVIVILFLVALNIIVFMKKYLYIETNTSVNNTNETRIQNQEVNTNYNTTSSEVDNENRENKIASLSEKLRMQTYFGQYISLIESKDYEGAYNLLYEGFKKTYFPTLEDFTNYAQANYPSNIVVEYTNIERQGTIFVLYVKIRNPLTDTTQTEVEERRVVIIESEVNNFKLSFEVNE